MNHPMTSTDKDYNAYEELIEAATSYTDSNGCFDCGRKFGYGEIAFIGARQAKLIGLCEKCLRTSNDVFILLTTTFLQMGPKGKYADDPYKEKDRIWFEKHKNRKARLRYPYNRNELVTLQLMYEIQATRQPLASKNEIVNFAALEQYDKDPKSVLILVHKVPLGRVRLINCCKNKTEALGKIHSTDKDCRGLFMRMTKVEPECITSSTVSKEALISHVANKFWNKYREGGAS